MARRSSAVRPNRRRWRKRTPHRATRMLAPSPFAQTGSNDAGVAPVASKQVTDPWFRDHFDHAASIVETWLRPEIDLQNAVLLDFGCGDGIRSEEHTSELQ